MKGEKDGLLCNWGLQQPLTSKSKNGNDKCSAQILNWLIGDSTFALSLPFCFFCFCFLVLFSVSPAVCSLCALVQSWLLCQRRSGIPANACQRSYDQSPEPCTHTCALDHLQWGKNASWDLFNILRALSASDFKKLEFEISSYSLQLRINSCFQTRLVHLSALLVSTVIQITPKSWAEVKS